MALAIVARCIVNRVYLAAIAACHVGFDGKTVGQHPLISCFMEGADHLQPVLKQLSPLRDSGTALDKLSLDLKVSIKTAFLLACIRQEGQ